MGLRGAILHLAALHEKELHHLRRVRVILEDLILIIGELPFLHHCPEVVVQLPDGLFRNGVEPLVLLLLRRLVIEHEGVHALGG